MPASSSQIPTTAPGRRHDYYPNLFSDEAVPTPTVLTRDYVVRSLRRRLWKAFQDDDRETALRAYQATFHDFCSWLQEEQNMMEAEQQRRQLQVENEETLHQKKDTRSLMVKRRSQKDACQKSNSRLRMGWMGSRSKALSVEVGSQSEIFVIAEKTKEELEQLFGDTAILESHMNPSERFIADDFLSPYDRYDQPPRKDLPDLQQHTAEQQALENARRQREHQRRRSRGPRQAFRMVMRGARGINEDEEESGRGNATVPLTSMEGVTAATSGSSDDSQGASRDDDRYMTTPLHEAARLGAGDFVRFLLAGGGDPNVKNGQGRTAMHMSAGGWTREEDRLTKAQKKSNGRKSTAKKPNKKKVISSEETVDERPIGIRAIVVPEAMFQLMYAESVPADEGVSSQKDRNGARGLMSRLFGSNTDNDDDNSLKTCTDSGFTENVGPDSDRLNAILTERMDTNLAVMAWVNEDTREGPSINAVDADGRTALHYAAEMGRSDICMAILSNFGAMLTVVDDLGARTPCELASARGHAQLAAQLEARALLYIDPYGLDEDMMENLLESRRELAPRDLLIPPFKWFQTLTLTDCAKERSQRLTEVRPKILSAFARCTGHETMSKGMEQVSKTGSDAALSHNSDDDERHGENDIEEPRVMINMIKDLDEAAGAKGGMSQPSTESSLSQENGGEVHCALILHDDQIEKYLSFYKWDTSDALEEVRKDPFKAFEAAGIELPKPRNMIGKTDHRLCRICYDDDVSAESWMALRGCVHGFCKDCLVDYISDCAASKRPMHSISCPHHECELGFSKDDIEYLLKDFPYVLARIAKGSNEHFISTANDLKFCPHPGCAGIVRRLPQPSFVENGFDVHLIDYTGGTCVACKESSEMGDACATLTYEGVKDTEYNNCRSLDQPIRAHRFCFACSEAVHWPVTCDRLEEWKEKVTEEFGEVIEDGNGTDFNDLAQKMWIRANTRPCPLCKVPIEKNDGCNHMTCTTPSCHHEFCWICRKDWKFHGSATGGFFRCNIWQEDEAMPEGTETSSPLTNATNTESEDEANDQGYGTAIYSAREAWKKKQEMNRFLHHYTRWEAHDSSSALERKMSDSVCKRLAPIVEAAMDSDGSPAFNFGGQGLSFIHSAFTELLECRSVLRHSYAFSFFRYPAFSHLTRRSGYVHSYRKEKAQFEKRQSELEVLTEQMSDIVARSHLRASQVQIQLLTAAAAEKRIEFTSLIFRILSEEEEDKAKQKKLDAQGLSNSRHLPNQSNVSTARQTAPPSISQLLTMHRQEQNNSHFDEPLTRAMYAFTNNLERARRHDDAEAENGTQMWACSRCTFMNTGGRRCAMCESLRGT